MRKYTGAQIEEAIREAQQKAADKLAELQELLKQDKEVMDQLKKDYFVALTAGDNSSIDSINEQLKEASQRNQDYSNMIEALSVKKNPHVQRIISDAIIAWNEDINSLDQQANKLFKELLPHHKALIEGLMKLQQLREKVSGYSYDIDRYGSTLSDENKAAVGYPNLSYCGVNITKYMNPLLIIQYVKR